MPTLAPRSRAADIEQLLAPAELRLTRDDIVFRDTADGRVAIEITLHNAGPSPSAPTHAVIQAAPLGAFVPWQPLAVLPVPALAPGDSVTLRTEAARPAPAPLGPPDRVPPRRLLTALGAADDRPRPMAFSLPADLAELLGHRNAHWAGNINVFVGRRAVERHMAQALRIYPGRVNLADFVVGGAGPDAFLFQAVAPGEDWAVKLHDLTESRWVDLDALGDAPIAPGHWVELPSQRIVFLSMTPPPGCGPGTVEIHVTQRSTAQEAVVEFSLDPAAAGPGSFVV